MKKPSAAMRGWARKVAQHESDLVSPLPQRAAGQQQAVDVAHVGAHLPDGQDAAHPGTARTVGLLDMFFGRS